MSADTTAADAAPQAAQTRATGSSFYAGMRVLPKHEREAMFAIYDFSRAVDDVADEGDAPPEARLAEFGRWRDAIEAVYAGGYSPRADFLRSAIVRYKLRKDDFLAVIDGCAMDAETIRAPDAATLDLYCDRVASAVGRLSIKVFGMDEEPGFKLSHHLGRALQLTNILRDLDEDAAIGRLYLPRPMLIEAGIASTEPRAAIADPAVDIVCRKLAKLAREHYAEAGRVFASRPRGLLRAPKLMAAVYSEILGKMEKTGWRPPRRRARISKIRLFLLALRYGTFG